MQKSQLPISFPRSISKDYFVVLFGCQAGVFNLLYVIQYAQKLGFKSTVQTIECEGLTEDASNAINFVDKLCPPKVRFDCTENGDYVFAHCFNECWGDF